MRLLIPSVAQHSSLAVREIDAQLPLGAPDHQGRRRVDCHYRLIAIIDLVSPKKRSLMIFASGNNVRISMTVSRRVSAIILSIVA